MDAEIPPQIHYQYYNDKVIHFTNVFRYNLNLKFKKWFFSTISPKMNLTSCSCNNSIEGVRECQLHNIFKFYYIHYID